MDSLVDGFSLLMTGRRDASQRESLSSSLMRITSSYDGPRRRAAALGASYASGHSPQQCHDRYRQHSRLAGLQGPLFAAGEPDWAGGEFGVRSWELVPLAPLSDQARIWVWQGAAGKWCAYAGAKS